MDVVGWWVWTWWEEVVDNSIYIYMPGGDIWFHGEG